MNTHATNLLHALIEGLMNATPTPELHAHQMLAAELKGAMRAKAIEDGQSDPQIDKPTPDADGWVENSGVDPNCMIVGLKTASGHDRKYAIPLSSASYEWESKKITHYLPA